MGEPDAAPPKDGVVVGVDIGGTKTALMATDLASGEDLATDSYPTPAEAVPDEAIPHLVEAIGDLLADAGGARATLRAVGVATPGLVNAPHGRVARAGNLRGWVDVPLRDLLARELGVPVFVEQDANAAALGEKWRGGAREMNDFVFLALGTGIGAGVMIGGRLYRGVRNAAGELGNLVVAREHLGQERGGVGDLASLIGGRTIRRRSREAAGEELSAADALAQASEDPDLAPIADDVADYVAMAVIAIAAVLDPEAVIFGGGTAEAGSDLLEPVRERVERELARPPALMRSVLGADAQLHGAVFGALRELDHDLALREEVR